MGATNEAKLVARALRQRWPMTDDQRCKAIEKLQGIIETSDDTRAIVSAVKALLISDKLNMEQEKRDLGIPDRVDITSGGMAVGGLTDEQLQAEIVRLEERERLASITDELAPIHTPNQP